MPIMKSDGGFVDFLKTRSGLLKVGAVLLLGLLLLIFGGAERGSTDSQPSEQALEERLAVACSLLDSAGECEVMITYGEDGEVLGVLVLCEGADNVEVRSDIKSLCATLFGIGSNRVSVLKIREENR